MPNQSKPILSQLHTEIDLRVNAIRATTPDWLCRQGCDNCCHRLAEVPRLSAAEWEWLQAGLAALPKEQLQQIANDLTAWAEQTTRPLVCPMLDKTSGACLVLNCIN
jgi:hypothetical protein